jgi:hypothetical protein
MYHKNIGYYKASAILTCRFNKSFVQPERH